MAIIIITINIISKELFYNERKIFHLYQYYCIGYSLSLNRPHMIVQIRCMYIKN